ncbi:MAG: TonB family protein [Gammaproteobacteria bacterium]|nr:TonB family protein [Gammaproteobacteria bacterium]
MMRIVNLGVAVVFAAGVTFALFFLMQFLISMDATEPEQGEGRKIADITMPEIELEVQRQEPKPEEPDVPEEIPDLPTPDISLDAPTGEGFNIDRVDVDMSGLDNNASISASDSEMLPIVTMEPQYPQRAASRGIEGWCLVSFTVTAQGTVDSDSIIVLDADPPNIFDSSSRRAVSRFKFNARVSDGEPISVPGVRYLFRYNLAEE